MYAYSSSADKWLRMSPRRRPSVCDVSHLRVLTYNVWFDPFEQERRTQALLAILRDEAADVMALQEVTPRFLQSLLNDPFIRAHYACSQTKLMGPDRYDVVMLSRLPVRSFTAHRITTDTGRRLHALQLATTRGSLVIAGIHLESMKERTPTRLTQIAECIPILSRAEQSIWLGDFNAAPSSEEDTRILHAFRDTWPELTDQPGYTRDTTRNLMLAKVKADRHQRIDRVFTRGELFAAQQVRMVGTTPLEGTSDVFPSDHFGLVADFDAVEQQAVLATGE